MTTAAFKLAGGVELATSLAKASKQNSVPQIFVSKITKAFLDALYSLLDGMVLLASDESPVLSGTLPDTSNMAVEELNPLQLLDLKDGVRQCTVSFVSFLHLSNCFAL
jgi:exocyst complex component 2